MFLVVGLVGLALLLVSLIFDDAIESILPDVGWLSGPIIGAFLAAFGIVGWTLEEGVSAPRFLAMVAGIGGGVGVGWFTFRFTRALMHAHTDDVPTTASLVGRPGRVVTPITAGRFGEVLVSVGGQQVKLSAVSTRDLGVGATVHVVGTSSATSVVVESFDELTD